MRRLLIALVVLVAIISVPFGTAARVRTGPHTKRQAEVNVLRVVSLNWKAWRRFGVIDRRTHLVADNTEAICRGRGTRYVGHRYSRFLCVVRPHTHRGREGLWLSYRALPSGRCKVRFLAYYRS
jgi:hypothetical protein